MPALPAVPNVLKIIWHLQVGVDTTTSTSLHARYTGTAPTNAQLDTYAGAVHQGYINGPILSTPAATSLLRTEVFDLTAPNAAYGSHSGTAAGTSGGVQPPAQCCVLVTYSIQRRYRGGKPRGYVPMGQMSDMLDAQHWTTAAATNFRTHWSTLMTAVASNAWPGGAIAAWCAVSYYHGAVWSQNPVTGAWKRHPTLRAGGPQVDDISDFTIETLTGTQRRRVRGKFS